MLKINYFLIKYLKKNGLLVNFLRWRYWTIKIKLNKAYIRYIIFKILKAKLISGEIIILSIYIKLNI